MYRSTRHWVFAALVLVTTAGCGGSDIFNPDPGTPSTPTTVLFSGTLTVNGAITHPFSALGSGTVTATLAALAPENATVGLSLGTWSAQSETCQLTVTKDVALQGTIVVGSASGIGNYCVRIYDVGKLAASTDYQVVLIHP